jgi:hypothetical protein
MSEPTHPPLSFSTTELPPEMKKKHGLRPVETTGELKGRLFDLDTKAKKDIV